MHFLKMIGRIRMPGTRAACEVAQIVCRNGRANLEAMFDIPRLREIQADQESLALALSVAILEEPWAARRCAEALGVVPVFLVETALVAMLYRTLELGMDAEMLRHAIEDTKVNMIVGGFPSPFDWRVYVVGDAQSSTPCEVVRRQGQVQIAFEVEGSPAPIARRIIELAAQRRVESCSVEILFENGDVFAALAPSSPAECAGKLARLVRMWRQGLNGMLELDRSLMRHGRLVPC